MGQFSENNDQSKPESSIIVEIEENSSFSPSSQESLEKHKIESCMKTVEQSDFDHDNNRIEKRRSDDSDDEEDVIFYDALGMVSAYFFKYL